MSTELELTMKRRKFLVVVSAAAAALAAGCGGGGNGATASAPSGGASSGTPPSISIRDFKFSPDTSSVRSGARVRVTNRDSAPHSVTADDGHSFDSGTVQPGASASIQAPGAGTYAYHCTIHPFMTGRLVVK
jgi:plastocyanin